MEELIRRLHDFKVVIGTDEAGQFTAFSNVEPCFCVVRGTEDEAKAAVTSIIASYARTFYGLEIEGVSLDEVPQQIRLPVTTVRPKSSWLPSFLPTFGANRDMVPAE